MSESNYFKATVLDFSLYRNIEARDPSPYKILAEGDSWFSIGSGFPPNTTNLLGEILLPQQASVVNCAAPGHTLRKMVDWRKNPEFKEALSRQHIDSWSAILLSAGGNDVIAAAGVRTQDGSGRPVRKDRRLLLTVDERPADGGLDRYISAEGWQRLHEHLLFWIGDIMARVRSRNNYTPPVFLHAYDYPFPVDDGNESLGAVLASYGVPQQDWYPLVQILINWLADTLATACLRHQGLFLIDGRGTLEDPADWENEIHPTRSGYREYARHITRQLITYGPFSMPVRMLSTYAVPEQMLLGVLADSVMDQAGKDEMTAMAEVTETDGPPDTTDTPESTGTSDVMGSVVAVVEEMLDQAGVMAQPAEGMAATVATTAVEMAAATSLIAGTPLVTSTQPEADGSPAMLLSKPA
jgi:lysophospholipase L1-like esterase